MNSTFNSLKKYKKEVILGPFFKTFEVIFELLIPFFVKIMIDKGIPLAKNNDYSLLIKNGLIVLTFVIFGFFSTLICQYFSSVASQGYGTNLRNEVFRKISNVKTEEFINFGKGNLLNLINNDINHLQLAVAMLIRLVIRAPALVIGSLICTFFINKIIMLFYLLIIIIVSIFLFIIFKLNSKKYFKLQERNDEIAIKTSDVVKGLKFIKSYNKEEYEYNDYKKRSLGYLKETYLSSFFNSLLNPFNLFIINIAIILTFYLIFKKIDNIDLNISKGSIIALVTYLNQILIALIVVNNLIVIFNKAYVSKKRVNNFLNNAKEEDYLDGIKTFKNESKYILEFKDVCFSYKNNDNYVLKNINFKVKNKSNIGIIGGTGSGKSSIIKLIDRLYNPSKGEILYYNIPINQINLNEYRKQISIVFQNSFLLNTSIKENLMMDNLDLSEEEILNTLDKTSSKKFVLNYDDKLNHELSMNGNNLSGGQKQRLSISRALLKKANLIIFDDCDNALDYITASKIRDNLFKEKSLTKIFVSQRIETILNCDEIIVLDKGQIVSTGNHEYLINNCPVYKEIYDSQKKDLINEDI
ncbi:MAG: ABC transporter ATP-binding protein [Bacillales bacterium]